MAAIHDAYLLRITSELSEGITGYSASETEACSQDVQLMYVLYWMDVLDQLWVARLEQHTTQLCQVQQRARAHFPTPDEADRVATVLQTSFSVSTSDVWHAEPRDTDVPPYGVTDRVRLRDELLNAREQLFAWMRSQKGTSPPPTTMDLWPSVSTTAHSAEEDANETNVEAEEEAEAESWAEQHLPCTDTSHQTSDEHYAQLFNTPVRRNDLRSSTPTPTPRMRSQPRSG